MIKPISPEEVADAKKDYFPDYVIQAVNESIAKNYSGGRAEIMQNEIITAIMENAKKSGVTLTRGQVFGNRYLDFEDIYRANGWQVEYDKPAYNENYQANFIFRRK